MKCVLIFDYTNDIIYAKYNKKFALHINELAQSQGLLTEECNTSYKLSANVIVQIFSPIVTSQRIMSCQFGNSYTAIQCEDGLNIIFEEYMGYLFLCIGNEDVPEMKRFLSTCVTIVRYICGPNILELKSNVNKSSLITHLIDCWNNLKNNDQGMFVEAIEQLILNPDLTSSTVQALHEAVDKMHHLTDCTRIHGLLLVQNKFLGLYSSQNAKSLSATDIMFSILLSESIKTPDAKSEVETDSEEEFYSPSTTPEENVQNSESKSHEDFIYSYHTLLTGGDLIPKCIPHILHICPITEGINLLLFVEIGSINVSTNLYDSFLCLQAMQSVQIQRDVETLRPIFDNLDIAIKKLCDALKKIKSSSIEAVLKQLNKQWEFMRKKYQEFIKMQSSEALLRAESMTIGLLDLLKEVLMLTAYDEDLMRSTQSAANESSKIVMEKLSTFDEFLKVKAMKNFSLGSKSSLTINKYLEEFPGLVHFIYIDRTNHRVTAPTLNNTDETLALTKRKIWSMINFSRTHLEEGHLSIIWKDTTFSYAYFLWFEDTSGSPLKPTVFPTHASKPLPQPGILSGDFYMKLKEVCFPKISSNKIRCYELYCVHLGLVTAQCVLEHTRRIAATIWELKGHPDHPIDLL